MRCIYIYIYIPTRRGSVPVHLTHARSHRGANYRSFTVRQIRCSNIQPVVAKNKIKPTGIILLSYNMQSAAVLCPNNEQSQSFEPGRDGLNSACVFTQSWFAGIEKKKTKKNRLYTVVKVLLRYVIIPLSSRSFVRHARTHKREKRGNMCLSEGQLLSANS